jgi:hypothetical protein
MAEVAGTAGLVVVPAVVVAWLVWLVTVPEAFARPVLDEPYPAAPPLSETNPVSVPSVVLD